jgi:hypothetical protein
MQTHITPNNKLASLGTIGLLFLAGIAGMVFLLPYANAATTNAKVTLSTITPLSSLAGGPTELTGVTSGIVGNSLTITGTGFSSNAAIAITSTVGTSTISWFTLHNNCGFATSIGGVGGANSLYVGSGSTACLTTSASGMFKTTVVIPALPGGAQTIVVTDGVNSVSTPFTITPSITFSTTSPNNFGFPETTLAGSTITITGFGSGESVTGATTAFSTTSFACTTGTTLSNTVTSGTSAGTCTLFSGSLVVADATGGAKTITATGATSTLTASTTYTINPWAAFYDSPTGKTSFAFIGTAPSSLFVEVHGMPAGTIAANSITVGGIATGHSAVTIGSSGAFLGLVVSPVTNVPFGNVGVVVGGTTFSYGFGNIAVGSQQWGGALISSIPGTSTSTAFVKLDASSYKPGAVTSSSTSPAPAQNQVGIFGFGFVPPTTGACVGGGGNIAFVSGGANWVAGTPGFQTSNCPVTGGSAPGLYVDANGAVFAKASLADTPWSTVGNPTVAASYTPTLTEAGTAPATIIPSSFTIIPWMTIGSSTVDYTTSNFQVKGHGFGPTDTLAVTIGGSPLLTGTSSCGPSANGSCYTNVGKVPELGAGPQNVVLTGSISGASVTTTGGTIYDPRIDSSGSGSALSLVTGNAGSTTILRTGSSFGVHGLYANTAYNVVWNGAGVSPILAGTVIGTFTSTATGGIPVPGVQLTIPADISGIHSIDLERVSTSGTSFMYANHLPPGDFPDSDTGLGTFAGNTCDGTVVCLHSQFGDMLFNLGTSLSSTPTVATVGSSITISGTGLQAATTYDLSFTQAGGSPPSTCPAGAAPPQVIAGSFTSTSTGAVPSGASIAITDTPTATGLEQGTLECIFIQTPGTFGTSTTAGTSEFLLQASATVTPTSATSGSSVTLSAHALNKNAGYTILFAPYTCGATNVCGTVVGSILTNGVGAGSGAFTVPSSIQTATGIQPVVSGSAYSVELQESGVATNQALASPPSVAVGSVTTACNNTTCMTVSGTPVKSTQGPYTGISSTFTNNSPSPETAFVYAVVHNALGQTVDISTATVTASAGGSATAFNVLFGLAPGTYTISVFVTSSSGTAISASTSVTVTI